MSRSREVRVGLRFDRSVEREDRESDRDWMWDSVSSKRRVTEDSKEEWVCWVCFVSSIDWRVVSFVRESWVWRLLVVSWIWPTRDLRNWKWSSKRLCEWDAFRVWFQEMTFVQEKSS